MCGIAGILIRNNPWTAEQLTSVATRMGEALYRRGPDDHGVWVDAAHGIALAHRRLSIIDLSPEGHQPMHSACGRYVISYNGEIYNYQALRAQLNYPWRGQSDTEVLLAAIAAWGIEKALAAMDGMFAFALWDRAEHTLTLARDRMGEKPLYYGQVGDTFVFASELKAFHTLDAWPPAIDRNALHLYMRYSYIPAPYSVYEGIRKLPPASCVSLRAGHMDAAPTPYWSLADVARVGVAQSFVGTVTEATDRLETLLKHAVGERMMADVPLGAFLSGGVDSSTIAALMQAQSARPVKTFTIGFAEQGFDEAPYAKAVAQHLGTEHREIYVSSQDAAAVIPQLPSIYDEPFADASQIPTYLVSKFAREHVTVALSGDGGDELLGGYNRYVRGPGIWRAITVVPFALRQPVARVLLAAHHALVHHVAPHGHSRIARLTRKLGNYYEKMGTRSAAEFYRNLCSVYDHPEQIVLGGKEPTLPIINDDAGVFHYAEWMMLADALTYFPGDILAKVDRAAMAVSLETRTPFTDPDLIAFAWQLPLSMKIRDGHGKWLLRQVLDRHVPRALIERPKAGFAVPIGEWLRGSLRAWAADLLAPETLRQQGYLNVDAVQAMWNRHQSGQRDFAKPLWNLLMFQSWLTHR